VSKYALAEEFRDVGWVRLSFFAFRHCDCFQCFIALKELTITTFTHIQIFPLPTLQFNNLQTGKLRQKCELLDKGDETFWLEVVSDDLQR
jgi:hypothetical protein